MNRPQRTLGRTTSFEGVGLHTGSRCKLTVHPAPAGSGIRFRRTDLGADVPVDPRAVTATSRGTTLGGEKGARLHTVEHFLSACVGLGLDNLLVEADGEEMPILDGSALEFLKGLSGAGVVEQGTPVEPLVLNEPFEFEDGAARVRVEPSERLELEVGISFPYPGLERQEARFVWAEGSFERELAGARTFCFEEEVEALRSQGLIRGGSLECALVVGRKGLLNGPLRYENEFARHKALDLLGDLALLNRPLLAKVRVEKGGHRVHVRLAQALREKAVPRPHGGTMLDIDQIQKIIPHRPPFLLVDRILEVEPKKRAVGIKNVTVNEDFFRGHFPGQPVMPGVLILEAMAQVGGVALLYGESGDNIVLFAAADNVRWRRQVVPGDQVRLEVDLVQLRGRLLKAHGRALVDGQVAAEADITCMRAQAPPKGGA